MQSPSLSKSGTAAGAAPESRPQRHKQDVLAVASLSAFQQGLLFHSLTARQADPYLMRRVLVIEGEVSASALAQAWSSVFARHPALRADYRWEEVGVPVQLLIAAKKIELESKDLRSLSDGQQQAELVEFLRQRRRVGFDFRFAADPCLQLWRVGENRHWLIWVFHHVTLDGWSVAQVFKEVLEGYRALLRPALPLQEKATVCSNGDRARRYTDYCQWRSAQDTGVDLKYFRDKLAGWAASTPLPLAEKKRQSPGGGEYNSLLNEAQSGALVAGAARAGVTLNTLIQGAWALLLGRYAAAGEVTFGVTCSGRQANFSGLESLVGCFINTLPLRIKLPAEQLVGDWLVQLQIAGAELLAHDRASLPEVVRQTTRQPLVDTGVQAAAQSAARKMGAETLFDTIVVVENFPVDKVLRQPDSQLSVRNLNLSALPPAVELSKGQSRSDLLLDSPGRTNHALALIVTVDNRLGLTLAYSRSKYTKEAVATLMLQFKRLLVQLGAGSNGKLREVQLATGFGDRIEPELALWSGQPTVLGLFARQLRTLERGGSAQRHFAVCSDSGETGPRRLSYRELELASNAWAHTLLKRGVKPTERVALWANRNCTTICSLWGVLKAGAAYVPLDPEWPEARIVRVLHDSGARFILGTQTHYPAIESVTEPDEGGSTQLPGVVVVPVQPAYVIYTSGSSGESKGVVVSHAALANYVQAAEYRLDWPKAAAFALVSTMAADLGHTMLFGALLSGGTLHLISPQCAADSYCFGQYLQSERIEVLKIVPSHLRGLLSGLETQAVLPSKLLVMGGEASDAKLVNTVARLRPECRLVNHYGPTEVTVGVFTHERFSGGQPGGEELPVGLPLANIRARLLGFELQPVPTGAEAELYLGGAGLADGYHGAPGLTADKFIPDPSGPPGSRAFRTQDRMRRQPDGTLEFLGRGDRQIKIRGQRIAPEELERTLLRLDQVDEVAVVVDRSAAGGQPQLWAYCVAKSAFESEEQLRGQLLVELSRKLPRAMIPSALVLLDEMPLTPNGKLDRARLPSPGERDSDLAHRKIRGEAAAKAADNLSAEAVILQKIWAEVLKLQHVSVDQSFFDLGGDSILSFQIIARARRAGIRLSAGQLFRGRSIAGILAVQAATSQELPPEGPQLRALEPKAGQPTIASLAQQRMWLLARLDPSSAAYQSSRVFFLKGELNSIALECSLESLIARHHSFQTVFSFSEETLYQRVVPRRSQVVHWVDLSNDSSEANSVGSWRRSCESRLLDLQAGPLLRVDVAKLSSDQHLMIVSLHHIISDEWSMRIAMREFAEFYRAHCAGELAQLEPLSLSYTDFASWQRRWLAAGEGQRQLEYWCQTLRGASGVLELPSERARPNRLSSRGGRVVTILDSSVVAELRELSRREGTTVFATLLATFKVLLFRFSGQVDVSVGVPMANRSRLELQGLVGLFVNTQVLRTVLDGRTPFSELLNTVADSCRNAQENADLPFERLVEALNVARSLNRSPLFQVMHNHVIRASADSTAFGSLRIEARSRERIESKFDLTLTTIDVGEGQISCSFVYAAQLYSLQFVERMARAYSELLRSLVRAPSTPIAELELLGQEEREVVDLMPRVPGGRGGGVWTKFAEQVRRRPDSVAIETLGAHYSYAVIGAWAVQVSESLLVQLRQQGLESVDSLIGVLAPRSVQRVVAFLAILRAGAAYLPLQPGQPNHWQRGMVGQKGKSHALRLVLNCPELEREAEALGVPHLSLHSESNWTVGHDKKPFSRVASLSAHSQALAYCIATSGSTGTPKGALNTVAGLEGRLSSFQSMQRLAESDVVLHKTPTGFDVSLWEMLWPLCSGARMVLAPAGMEAVSSALGDVMRTRGVTHVHFVPTLLRLFVQQGELSRCNTLRQLMCGGESLPADLRDQVLESAPFAAGSAELRNFYGPAETAMEVTTHQFVAKDLHAEGRVPVGQALPGVTTYVLDAQLQVVPQGVVGELFVGGECLGRGYRGMPGLTAERFVPHPFASGQRLYRTGDLARCREDQLLELLGRSDRQVKLRGVRIEPGEVEACILKHPSVREVAVGVQGEGSASLLVAHVVLTAGPVPSRAEPGVEFAALRAFVAERLPGSLRPSLWAATAALPRLLSGKLDWASLPEVDPQAIVRSLSSPQSPTESRVRDVWQEVLELKGIGRQDDFFALGGHSLAAMQVVARLTAHYCTEVALAWLFEDSSLEGFSRLLDQRRVDRRQERSGVTPLGHWEPVAASPSQRRHWLLWSLMPDSSAYNVTVSLGVEGVLDAKALGLAFRDLLSRHSALRTTFQQSPREQRPLEQTNASELAAGDSAFLLQTVMPAEQLPANPVGVQLLDPNLSWGEREQLADKLSQEQFGRAFDLAQGPLWRVQLLGLGQGPQGVLRHRFLICLHHSIADAWSLRLLHRELLVAYAARAAGQEPELGPKPIQYRDYASWQQQWLQAGEARRQLSYWKSRLQGATEPLELPGDGVRSDNPNHRGAVVSRDLGLQLSGKLAALAKSQGVTLFSLLLASFQGLLYRTVAGGGSAQQAEVERVINVGVPVAGRRELSSEGVVGCFVNTVVVRGDLSPSQRFSDLLRDTGNAVLNAQRHQDVPFEQVLDAVGPERSLEHHPLFQVLFNHEVQDGRGEKSANGPQFVRLRHSEYVAKFDLQLQSTLRVDGRLSFAMVYAVERFSARRVERLALHFERWLVSVVNAVGQRLDEIPLLSESEVEGLLRDSCAPIAKPSTGSAMFVHEAIEKQAKLTPDALALGSAEGSLSYAGLWLGVQHLARQLIACGAKPGARVAVVLPRSLELSVSLLAAMRTGAAYVPIDPAYPQARLQQLLLDPQLVCLVTTARLRSELPAVHCPLVIVEEFLTAAELATERGSSLVSPSLHAASLAYSIYTSGSTGKPKAADNTHAGLANRLRWMQRQMPLAQDDAVIQKTSASFDVSVWEFFWPLMVGARQIVPPPGAQRDPEALSTVVRDWFVSHAHFVPSMLQQFVQTEDIARLPSLRTIISSGEALSYTLLERVLGGGGNSELYNLYGPTEAAIDVSVWRGARNEQQRVPIGRAIDGLELLILDNSMNLVSQGNWGELYLGGVGVGQGYHSAAAQTAERHVPHPWRLGQRLYRTGDCARLAEDGEIEYLGRLDTQIKVRGFRVEPGEIERALCAQPNVTAAAVVGRSRGVGLQLIAYVSLTLRRFSPIEGEPRKESLRAQAAQLREALRGQLPSHMIPSHVSVLEALPVTANGKLDRRALPEPETVPGTAQSGGELKSTPSADYEPMEREILQLWGEVLNIADAGLEDNFFERGGDSILALQLVGRARQLGLLIRPRDVFLYQTPFSLAQAAERAAQLQKPTALRNTHGAFSVSEAAVLTPIQAWFFERELGGKPAHFNQSVLLTPEEVIEPLRLERALTSLVQSHSALLARFELGKHGHWRPRQSRQSSLQFESKSLLRVLRVETLDGDKVRDEYQRLHESLSLIEGVLLRALLLTTEQGRQRLYIVCHHLAIDGVSWRIVLEQLQSAYRQNVAVVAAPFSCRYADWAQTLAEHAQSEHCQKQLGFWLAQTKPEGLGEIPRDNPLGRDEERFRRTEKLTLSRRQTSALLGEAMAAYRMTTEELLLTALARVFCAWSKSNAVLIECEGHGREDLFDNVDVSGTVGWFTTRFPVRIATATGQAWADCLPVVKEQLRTVPERGLGYGVLRYLGTTEQRNALKAGALPRITFNYLGQLDGSFRENSLWKPAAQPGVRSRAIAASLDNWLSVSARVYAGQFSIHLSYSEELFELETIRELTAEIDQQLNELVGHCTSGKHGQLTPSDFSLCGLSAPQLQQLLKGDLASLAPQDIEDLYPLSPLAEGLLFHSLKQSESPDVNASALYVNQLSVRVEGLTVERLRDAWAAVHERHAVLRTRYTWSAELQKPLAVVMRRMEASFEVVVAGVESVESVEKAARRKGFDLAEAPLQRLLVVEQRDGSHQLIWTHHHIQLDGWSASRLVGEVLSLYSGARPRQAVGRYRDFIQWLQHRPSSKAFWLSQLADLSSPTLVGDVLRVEAPSIDDQSKRSDGPKLLWLEEAETSHLQASARAQHITFNTLIQGAWLLVLSRNVGQNVVCFGATVAGRPAEVSGSETQLGLFINTLPVVAEVKNSVLSGDWLRQLQEQNVALREHEHSALPQIQAWAGQSGRPLFDSLVVFENYPVDQVLREAGKRQLAFGVSKRTEKTNYPLTLAVHEGRRLRLDFHFDSSLACSRVEALGEQVLFALRGLAEGKRLGQITLLSDAQQPVQTEDWNKPADIPKELNTNSEMLYSRVQSLAEQRPDAIAVVMGEHSLSYGALWARASTLAGVLRSAGVGAESLVALCAEPGPELIVGLFGILLSGGAYLPLDPNAPRLRLAGLIAQSGAFIAVTQSSLRQRLPNTTSIVELDSQPRSQPGQPLSGRVEDSGSLAYCIYTSGSTGRPKAVMVSHRSAVGTTLAGYNAYHYQIGDEPLERLLLLFSIAFDGAVASVFWVLNQGGTLHLLPEQERSSPQHVLEQLDAYGMAHALCVPGFYTQLLDAQLLDSQGPARYPCSELRTVMVAGEACSPALVARHRRLLPHVRLINKYGPTEAAIWSASHCVEPGDTLRVPVGKPVSGVQLYVLDTALQSAPLGASGELYIGGVGVARGYLGEAALTAERFVPDPFSGRSGARLYRSGDVARCLWDGKLEVLGRQDRQIKLNGVRLEPGEIEAVLCSQPEVVQAAVVVSSLQSLGSNGRGEPRLVAYLELSESADKQGVIERAAQNARQMLPAALVPTSFSVLEKLPTTPNGKRDEEALRLLATELQQGARTQAFEAPIGDVEKAIADVFGEVLGLEVVGRDDDFFQLGGHSLHSTRVVMLLHAKLELVVPLRDLFDHPSVKSLATTLQAELDASSQELSDLESILKKFEG